MLVTMLYYFSQNIFAHAQGTSADISCFIMFNFNSFHRHYVFYKLKVCGSSALSGDV